MMTQRAMRIVAKLHSDLVNYEKKRGVSGWLEWRRPVSPRSLKV